MRTERGATAAERWERSARFWLRAYPRRWRAARAEEVLAVLMDLAAPGARRVGVRTAVDLVRGGWATRWREHPPVGRWVAYGFDVRIPRQYRGWVADDIEGFLFPVRRPGPVIWLYPFLAVLDAQNPSTASFGWRGWLVLMGVLIALSMVVAPRNYREQARRRHLAAEAGEPLTSGTYVARPAPRPRVLATAAAPRVVGGLGLAAVLSSVAAVGGRVILDPNAIETDQGVTRDLSWLITRPGLTLAVLGALAVALGVGLLRARRARRRLALALPGRPAQPHRVLTTSHRAADLWSTLGVLAVAADAWLEATGRWPLIYSPLIAVGAWVTLPWAIALVRYRDPVPGLAPLAWSDLRWAAGWASPPTVDQPVAVVRPYEGSDVEGAVVAVWPWRAGVTYPPGPPLAS